MIGKGYTHCHYCSCVYFQEFGDSFIYLLLYVDDTLIASKDKSLISKLKSQLNNEFMMKDLGIAKKIFSMEIHKGRKDVKLYLSQRKYLEKVIDKLNMTNCKPMATPLAPHFKLLAKSYPASEEEIVKMSHVPYSTVVGGLMHVMVCTRPDLAYAVSVVSRIYIIKVRINRKL